MADYPDFEGGKSKLFTAADWAAVEGTDKNLFASASVPTGTTTTILDYTVPAGKTLYVCQWGFNIAFEGGMSSQIYFTHDAAKTRLAASGGYNGGGIAFTKPIVVIGGDIIGVEVLHGGGVNKTCKAHIGGYEI